LEQKLEKELEQRQQIREQRKRLKEMNELSVNESNSDLNKNEKFLKQMDSSIKKNASLTKKLKTVAITESNYKQLVEDFEKKINASKYASECVLGISLAKLKGSDALYASEVASSMFRTYVAQRKEIQEQLRKHLQHIATPMSSAEAAQLALSLLALQKTSGGGDNDNDLNDNNDDDNEENKIPTPLLRRAKLCLLAELYLVNIIDSPKYVYEVVKKHAEMEYDVAPEAYLQSLSALAFFAKQYSLEFLGKEDVSLSSSSSSEVVVNNNDDDDNNKVAGKKKNDEEDQNNKYPKCKAEVCQKFAEVIYEKYEKDAIVKLKNAVKLASTREQDVLKVLKTKGEVPGTVSSAFSKATATRDALLKQCQTLAEALRIHPIPQLEHFQDENGSLTKNENDDKVNKIELDRGLKQQRADLSNNSLEWENDDQRRFYEDLLPIKESIPAVLLVEKPAPDGETEAEKKSRESKESNDFKVDALINRLRRDCENAEKIDAFAVDFCYVATAGAKKRLAEELLNPPELIVNSSSSYSQQAGDLNNNNNNSQSGSLLSMSPMVPFYARVLKLMSKVFPEDISDVVASKVMEKFFQLNKKDGGGKSSSSHQHQRGGSNNHHQQQQQQLKVKLQNVYYVSELIKFGLIDSAVDAMQCLQILIENFETRENAMDGSVELVCAFIRRCGRFLSKSVKSKKRCNSFLDIFLRFKSVARQLDEAQIALIDEAYFSARPREVFRALKPPKPVMFEYVKHLFVEKMSTDPQLAKKQLGKVLKHCEVMNDFRLERYVVERAIKHSQEKFDDAELTAKLMYKLSQNQKNEKKNDIIIKFADAALEEFRFGLEMNLNYMVQKRVANARVIGELFAQRCLHADTIFSCLFLLLTHGKSTIKNNNIVSNSDNDSDPRDSIRVRIAAVLLEKCGKYFNRGWQKKKLDVFLTYFQRYKCSKILSMDVNNDANNIMRELRPTIKICETFAEANAMCVQMEEKFGVVSVDEKTKKESAGGLATLAENDEEIDEDEDDIEEEDEEEEEDEDDIEEEEEFDDNEIEEEASSDAASEFDSDDEDDISHNDDDDDDDDDDNDNGGSSDESESSESEEEEVEVRMEKVVATRQEQSDFEREMEKFLGVGSVKASSNSIGNDDNKNKNQAHHHQQQKNFGMQNRNSTSSSATGAASIVAFKMMRKGKDGKREKVDIALPETASFAMEAKKRQIMEAEELSEVRRLTLQRTVDMQEEAIEREENLQSNAGSWKKKPTNLKSSEGSEGKWNIHRRL